MNVGSDDPSTAFRAEVRAFITRALPEVVPRRTAGIDPHHGFSRAERQAWIRAMDARGWAVPHWPESWGGCGWPIGWRSILEDELAAANCPGMDVIGIDLVGPLLCAFGTRTQQERYLPRIRCGDEWWCQGFSEASAGSDLTSLSTSAVLNGDHFRVTGRKLWVTNAHLADMMFALVRVAAPGNRRQQGVSFVLIDMHTTGVSVRPIVTIDGVHRVNEVELDDVQVPVANLVGEQGKGWLYARYLLDHERRLVAQLPGIRQLLELLRGGLAAPQSHGSDGVARRNLAQLQTECQALEYLELRFQHAPGEDPRTHMLASMLKLRGSELRQRISEALWETLGEPGAEASTGAPLDDHAPDAAAARRRWCTRNYFYQRSSTILGGTSEVQRNIIAGIALGLEGSRESASDD